MDNCPKCEGLLYIVSTYTTVTGDQSPDTPTEVFTNNDRACRNKDCSQYGMVVETVKNKIL